MSKLSCTIAFLLLLSSSVVWAETTVSDINPSTPAEKQLIDAAKQLEQTAPQATEQAQEALKQAVNQANQMASQMQNEMAKAQDAALSNNTVGAPAASTPKQNLQQKGDASQKADAPSSTHLLEQALIPNTLPQPSAPPQINIVTEAEAPVVDVVKKIHPLADLKLAGGLVVLAALLLLWVFWQPKSKAQKVTVAEKKKGKQPRFMLPNEEGHDEGEYDFLATEEAIPVKLDLARAYIDMDEAESARTVLKSVLEKGDSEQKSEAKALLKELELKL